MMTLKEQVARIRAHGNNIVRYQRLLKTRLTDQEREFISLRLSEEQSIFAALNDAALPVILNGRREDKRAQGPGMGGSLDAPVPQGSSRM